MLLKKLSTSLTSVAMLMALAIGAAHATSPVEHHIKKEPMIKTMSFTAKDYQSQADTKMYPAPEAGMKQVIIDLAKLPNEQDYKLEINIGKMMEVDCNHHRLAGKIIKKTVKGWGYDYYQVDSINPGMSTMMACPDKPQQKFVLMESMLVNYDSRLPEVFYVPEDTTVSYRIWQATDTVKIVK